MKKMIIASIICLLTLIMIVQPYIEVAEAASIQLNTTNLTLQNIRSYTLKVKNTKKKVTWSSSNKKVATVNSKGLVKAIKNGTCYVYAKIAGKKLKCKVTVKTPTKPTAVKLNKTSLSLNWGNSYTLKATLNPTNVKNQSLKWSSSNTSVATISSQGKVIAKNPGTATVTVTTSNNKKATCKITVNNQYFVSLNTLKSLNVSKKTNKIIVVSTKNTLTHYCYVQYFEKSNNQWKEVFKVAGSVGKNGINKVKEGDKKTPTGLFYFTQIMGIANYPDHTIMPYHKIDQNDYWCGEKYYNQFVDEDKQEHQCSKKSDEKFIDYTQPYQYLAVFNFNTKYVKGKGSAIFLHCSTKSGYTSGCIAVSNDKMKFLLQRIDKNTAIIIDQSKNISKY